METEILTDNNFKFNKQFGQNFIFDTNLLNAIVSDSGITKDDDVLEIGPGAGTLTKILARNSKKVVSYEIDKKLKEILSENLKEEDNVKVIFQDALKTNIKEIEENFSGRYKIVANLPYYITTPLIFKFVEETKNVDSITIMVQKEVANRLVAKNKSKDYGTISIILDFYGDVQLARNVSRKMFIPSPNVDSAVVRIDLKNKNNNTDEKLFKKVVRGAFSMRRKTLVNNLSKEFNLDKNIIINLIIECGFLPTVRGEELSTNDYINLTNKLNKIINK